MLHAQVWYPPADFGSSGCAELVWVMLHTRPWHLTAASNPPGHTAGVTELLLYCELTQSCSGSWTAGTQMRISLESTELLSPIAHPCLSRLYNLIPESQPSLQRAAELATQ